jgi:hypothetical protein
MELNISKNVKQIIAAFLLLILPLLTILLGIFLNVLIAWYYIIAITWFGLGIIFFSATN